MRTSVLSRSVVAVASLALASAALTSAPASAAPSEVTRAEVLAVTDAVRAESPTSSPGAYSIGTMRALQALATRACSVEQNPGQYVYGVDAIVTQTGQGADGLAVRASVYREAEPMNSFVHVCDFGAVASRATSSALSGSAQLGQTPTTTPLSGEVTVTPPILYPSTLNGPLTFRTTGQSTQSVNVVTSKKVSTPKSSKTKKYAKKKYAKRIKAAKKSYAKALKKAGHSKTKKAAAKKSYVKKRATAKAAYRKSVATFKIVRTTTVRKTSTPFDLSALG